MRISHTLTQDEQNTIFQGLRSITQDDTNISGDHLEVLLKIFNPARSVEISADAHLILELRAQ